METAEKEIDAIIEGLDDWRGEALARIRRLIKEADPDVVEEVKWKKPSNPAGVPVWSHDGIICTGETYRDKVKVTFMQGASLEDPEGLFNASLEGNMRRAIDLHEGDGIDEKAFKALLRAAATLKVSWHCGGLRTKTRPLGLGSPAKTSACGTSVRFGILDRRPLPAWWVQPLSEPACILLGAWRVGVEGRSNVTFTEAF